MTSRGRGRQSKVPLEIQMELFRSHKNDIFEPGTSNLKPFNDAIYENLGINLDMSKNAVYLRLQKCRSDLALELNLIDSHAENIAQCSTNIESEHSASDGETPSVSEISSNGSEQSASGNVSKTNDKKKPVKLLFTVNVTGIFTVEYRQTKRNGRDEAVKRVKKGWTDDLYKVLWDATRISCPWSFNNAWTKGEKIYVKAVCKECSARLEP